MGGVRIDIYIYISIDIYQFDRGGGLESFLFHIPSPCHWSLRRARERPLLPSAFPPASALRKIPPAPFWAPAVRGGLPWLPSRVPSALAMWKAKEVSGQPRCEWRGAVPQSPFPTAPPKTISFLAAGAAACGIWGKTEGPPLLPLSPGGREREGGDTMFVLALVTTGCFLFLVWAFAVSGWCGSCKRKRARELQTLPPPPSPFRGGWGGRPNTALHQDREG